MNGKTAKMLRKLGASKADKRFYKKLPCALKAVIRDEYNANTKLAHTSLNTVIGSIIHDC